MLAICLVSKQINCWAGRRLWSSAGSMAKDRWRHLTNVNEAKWAIAHKQSIEKYDDVKRNRWTPQWRGTIAGPWTPKVCLDWVRFARGHLNGGFSSGKGFALSYSYTIVSLPGFICTIKYKALNMSFVWRGGSMVGRRIRDRKVAGSTPGLCATT